MFRSLCCALVNWLSERYAIFTLSDVNHPLFVTEHLLLPISSYWFRGQKKKSDVIGCPFCSPHFCCYGWCIPSSDAITTFSQSPVPPPKPSYSIVSSPAISLCFVPSSLIFSISLSPLHLLLPPSTFLDRALIHRASVFLSSFVCFFWSLPHLLLPHLSAARLTYISASRTVEAAPLVFTECGWSPVSVSVGHDGKKGSLLILSLSCPTATCLRLTGIILN